MPRFKPGQSGNPRGRPPAGTSLAECIRELGGDSGRSYAEMLHRVAMDEKQPTRLRIDAVKILLDRGWGKPPQEVSVSTGTLADATPDTLAALSDDDLEEFISLTGRARALLEV